MTKIGYFPDPYPGELFYSTCARFSYRTGFNTSDVLDTLFGNPRTPVYTSWPTNLTKFITRLPESHNLYNNADEIIRNHTLFPLYAPFLSQERRQQLRHSILFSPTKRIHIFKHRNFEPEYFRYCPLCIEEDKRLYQETYWHRLHQVAGVQICIKHSVYLENTGIPIKNPIKAIGFLTADKALKNYGSNYQPVGLTEDSYNAMKSIVEEISWLLNDIRNPIGIRELTEKYNRALHNRNLSTYFGIKNRPQVVEQMTSYYSKEFLASINCEINEGDANWVYRLLRGGREFHPLYHILLTHLLGYTLQEFFSLENAPLPFGIGPWPCLNPVCEHFNKPVIPDFRILQSYWPSTNREYRAAFKCDCGFEYQRWGPELEPNDRYKYSRIISRGALWEKTFVKLWADKRITAKDIALKMGCSHHNIYQHAQRLHLKGRRTNQEIISKFRGKRAPPSENKIHEMRNLWLKAIKENPGMGFTKLSKLYKKIYSWLVRNDNEWFQQNRPAPQKKGRAKTY